jgi:hypothetical protein
MQDDIPETKDEKTSKTKGKKIKRLILNAVQKYSAYILQERKNISSEADVTIDILQEVWHKTREKYQHLERKLKLVNILYCLIVCVLILSALGFVPVPIVLACLKKCGVIAVRSFIKGISFAGFITLISSLSLLTLLITTLVYHKKVYKGIDKKFIKCRDTLSDMQADERKLKEITEEAEAEPEPKAEEPEPEESEPEEPAKPEEPEKPKEPEKTKELPLPNEEEEEEKAE